MKPQRCGLCRRERTLDDHFDDLTKTRNVIERVRAEVAQWKGRSADLTGAAYLINRILDEAERGEWS